MGSYSYDVWNKIDVTGWFEYGLEFYILPNDTVSYVDPIDGLTKEITTAWCYGSFVQETVWHGTGEVDVHNATPTLGLIANYIGGSVGWEDGTSIYVFNQSVTQTIVNPTDSQIAAFGTVIDLGYAYFGPDVTSASVVIPQGTAYSLIWTWTLPDYYWAREVLSVEAGFTEGDDNLNSDPDKFPTYMSRPGRLRGDLTKRWGWDLCQSFMACIGVRLPKTDCGNCVL